MLTIQKATSFAEAMKTAMEKKKLTLRDLSGQAQLTYEHVRSIARGFVIPSTQTALKLGKLVGLDASQAEKLATDDRIRAKYGRSIAEFAGKDPELAALEPHWKKLNASQRATVIQLIETMAKAKGKTHKTSK
jgi:transcriptional regulator with XRE-family HTH domain